MFRFGMVKDTGRAAKESFFKAICSGFHLGVFFAIFRQFFRYAKFTSWLGLSLLADFRVQIIGQFLSMWLLNLSLT